MQSEDINQADQAGQPGAIGEQQKQYKQGQGDGAGDDPLFDRPPPYRD